MRHFSTIVFILITSLCFAQRPYSAFQPVNLSSLSETERNVVDTVRPISFVPLNEGGLGCFTGVYGAPDSGYVSGNNQYGDLEKAQFYSLAQMKYGWPATLLNVIAYFGLKTMNAAPGDIYARVYAVDTNGFQPGDLLATSNPVNLATVNADGFPTVFTFPASIPLGDSFFVSIVLPISTGDTAAIVSTVDECSGFSNWSWEWWGDSTWHTLLNSWILDVDLAIFPVMDMPYGVGIEQVNNFTSWSIYPNPSSGIVAISIISQKSEQTELRIYNSFGALIERRNIGYLKNGVNAIEVDVSNYAAGLYSIELQQGLVVSQHMMSVIK